MAAGTPLGSATDDSLALAFLGVFWELERLCNATLWKWLVSGVAADDSPAFVCWHFSNGVEWRK